MAARVDPVGAGGTAYGLAATPEQFMANRPGFRGPGAQYKLHRTSNCVQRNLIFMTGWVHRNLLHTAGGVQCILPRIHV